MPEPPLNPKDDTDPLKPDIPRPHEDFDEDYDEE